MVMPGPVRDPLNPSEFLHPEDPRVPWRCPHCNANVSSGAHPGRTRTDNIVEHTRMHLEALDRPRMPTEDAMRWTPDQGEHEISEWRSIFNDRRRR